MFAAFDPAGPFGVVCGITWTLLCPTSGAAAFVAAILCPFKRTAGQALRLAKVGVWTGWIAIAAVALGVIGTAGFPHDPPDSLADGLILALLTAIAPAVAMFARRIARRKQTPNVHAVKAEDVSADEVPS